MKTPKDVPALGDRTVAVELTAAVRKALKIYAAEHDLTIKVVVNAALTDYLKLGQYQKTKK